MAQDKDGLALVQASEDRSEIVIDFKSKSASYPSMEEEMSIYLKLKNEKPQAFFFPNPSNGILWIEHNLGPSVALIITDVSGKAIFTAKSLNANKLDMKGFKGGNYFLILKSDKGEVKKAITVKE